MARRRVFNIELYQLEMVGSFGHFFIIGSFTRIISIKPSILE
jgi:hypothetical protein